MSLTVELFYAKDILGGGGVSLFVGYGCYLSSYLYIILGGTSVGNWMTYTVIWVSLLSEQFENYDRNLIIQVQRLDMTSRLFGSVLSARPSSPQVRTKVESYRSPDTLEYESRTT